jgi:hypothetical protein
MNALTTPDQIQAYRRLTLIQMLKLEIRGMHKKGRSAYSILKEETGLKGTRQQLLEQLTKPTQ